MGQQSGHAHKALDQSQVLIAIHHSRVFNVVKCINPDSSHCRARRDYWEKQKPASGRPFCPSLSKPDNWGVTKGHADLMQQKEATSQEELKGLFQKADGCQ